MAYPQRVYDAVAAVYAARQRRKEQELEERKKEAYAKVPRLREIDDSLSDTGRLIAKCVTEGSGAIRSLAASLKKLRAEKSVLLEKNGFEKDYLEMQYDCPLCRDTGINHGRPCSRCADRELHKAAFGLSSLGKTLSGQRFDNFDLDFYSDEGSPSPRKIMEKNLGFCKDFCEGFEKNGGSVLMTGGTGLGKTHLSSAIAQALIEKGFSVSYVTAPEYFDKLEKVRFARLDGDEIREYEESDVLIVDDLGSEMTTQFTVAALFSAINSRVNSGRSMIISTNIPITQLEDYYNDKIVSRLLGSFNVLRFAGSDIRLLKKQSRK